MSTSVQVDSKQSSISVAVRIRPFTDEENQRLINFDSNTTNNNGINALELFQNQPNGIRNILECIDDKLLIFDPQHLNPLNKISENILNSIYSSSQLSRRHYRKNGGELRFIFDKLLDQNSTQQHVFQSTTEPLLDSILDGYNGTVFAYGATGCGKTYTISGTPENPGIIFLTLQSLFNKIENLKDTKEISISLSYLEIYNESIKDLLDPTISSKKLVIREDANNKISVSNLSTYSPATIEEVMDLIIQGNLNRTTSSTHANETSSRSHAVLQIHLTQQNKLNNDINSTEQLFSTLSIIDLAGSERAASTKNRGETLLEGANINKSLLALGNCINALCINTSSHSQQQIHIPYRDSKLTRLLKFSLGGNCKTVMIVCVSPSSKHYDETLNTLKYANRAKEIKTKIIRNQLSLNRHISSYLKMITQQKQEIENLRKNQLTIINNHLSKIEIDLKKIEFEIDQIISNLKRKILVNHRFKIIKFEKSLILCKRRFFSLILIELRILQEKQFEYEMINQIIEHFQYKINQLELQFDSNDYIDLVFNNIKTIDIKKLKLLNGWDEYKHEKMLFIRLDQLYDSIKNEIIMNSSLLIDKLIMNKSINNLTHILTHSKLMNEESLLGIESEGIETRITNLINEAEHSFEEFSKPFYPLNTLEDEDDENEEDEDDTQTNLKRLSLIKETTPITKSDKKFYLTNRVTKSITQSPSPTSLDKVLKFSAGPSNNNTSPSAYKILNEIKPVQTDAPTLDVTTNQFSTNKKVRWMDIMDQDDVDVSMQDVSTANAMPSDTNRNRSLLTLQSLHPEK
ncbi:hypothetical protein TBLA_0C04960 [Henningerozyma blattae CBS 6284]|uniref:Kinesin-like protein n=1 Tax=Henningerozyma blattae (strain ATCC 34711 / CBS 6284 / DSM 70876 / NBRC 10599 / NRRL Y-10934 / UCD 77-7) TaxID=1071380 RepID=I2H1P0_HENB6|nr:hypothetical protein TBLA_0C04960 [Tetrapisispora blattae CBS 6284]CCH60292.1 hypothetical protein TBLA_0C04960 [Tetrapisispora blattae CBS 6284]